MVHIMWMLIVTLLASILVVLYFIHMVLLEIKNEVAFMRFMKELEKQ